MSETKSPEAWRAVVLRDEADRLAAAIRTLEWLQGWAAATKAAS